MKEAQGKADVGIVVGRFQVHELHEAHKELIDSVRERHSRVIVFLGISPLRNTINNPLDFKSRQKMIGEVFPDVEVYHIEDVPSDEAWSQNLDAQIGAWLTPNQTAMLYGSRDCFIAHYKGKHPTCVLESKTFISGTELRKAVSINYPVTREYRAGLIAATAHRHPTAYQTVDIAVLNETGTELLLAKKTDESEWRFIGGFSRPESPALEADARREVMEESNVSITDPVYIGSARVDDWRYRGEKDCIKTALFAAKYLYGNPKGGDDVAEVAWFKLDALKPAQLVECHRPLLDLFLAWREKNEQHRPENG